MTELTINPLNAELNPICHLLALLGAHHILHVSRIRVKAVFGSLVGLWWTTKVRIMLFSVHVVMMYVSRVDLQEGVSITPRRSATRCVPFLIWVNSYRTNTNYRCSFITDSVSEDTRQLPVN